MTALTPAPKAGSSARGARPRKWQEIPYGDDLEKVKQVVTNTLGGIENRDRSRDVEVFFTDFGGSSIDLVGRFWVDYERQPDFFDAQSRAIVAIKKTFDTEKAL